MQEFSRREFLLLTGGALSAQLWGSLSPPGFAALPGRKASSILFDLPNGALTTIFSDQIRIGSSIYPFRKPHRPDWLLSECKDIGFNSVRFAYTRNQCQRGNDSGPFDAHAFRLPNPDIGNLVRSSGFHVIMTVQGHSGDAKGESIEWPRNGDGSINGRAAAQSFANYTHWLVQHTRDFVDTYELWNEAFGHIDDKEYKMSFGPGGSKENADNYAEMMAPAMKVIRRLAPDSTVTIEGNYWNIDKSAAQSPAYRQLLAATDYVVKHPYGYDELAYSSAVRTDVRPSQLYEQDNFFRSINPRIKWCFTEYAPTAHVLGVDPKQVTGRLQAKGFLRATVLHLRHGVTDIYPFALYYPTAPANTLIEEDGTRRPAWYALQHFLLSCKLNEKSTLDCLKRATVLPQDCRDLAIANASGFAYYIWQETDPMRLKFDPPLKQVTVNLGAESKRPLQLLFVKDLLSGKEIQPLKMQHLPGGNVSITFSVPDYPIVCQLRVANS